MNNWPDIIRRSLGSAVDDLSDDDIERIAVEEEQAADREHVFRERLLAALERIADRPVNAGADAAELVDELAALRQLVAALVDTLARRRPPVIHVHTPKVVRTRQTVLRDDHGDMTGTVTEYDYQ